MHCTVPSIYGYEYGTLHFARNFQQNFQFETERNQMQNESDNLPAKLMRNKAKRDAMVEKYHSNWKQLSQDFL